MARVDNVGLAEEIAVVYMERERSLPFDLISFFRDMDRSTAFIQVSPVASAERAKPGLRTFVDAAWEQASAVKPGIYAGVRCVVDDSAHSFTNGELRVGFVTNGTGELSCVIGEEVAETLKSGEMCRRGVNWKVTLVGGSSVTADRKQIRQTIGVS